MASSVDYLQYVLELCKGIEGLAYKKMMGEYILYQDGVIFGGVYDNRFLIKKTPSASSYGLKEEIPYPSAKPMLLVDIENPREIQELVQGIVDDLKEPR